MKTISILVLAAVITLQACKQKTESNTKREDEINIGGSTVASTASTPEEGTVQATLTPQQKENVKEAEKILAKPELTPKDVVKEMNKLAKEKGLAALQVGMCNADRVFMDSMIAIAVRMEKALEINMMGMVDGQMSQTRWDENKFIFDNEKINGNTATLEVTDKKSKKKLQTINFVKENGAWKICENVQEKSKGQQDPMAMMRMVLKMVENATPEGKQKFREMMMKNMESMKSLQKDTLTSN